MKRLFIIISMLLFISCGDEYNTYRADNIVIDTDEGVELQCIPVGYRIVYNGYVYTWKISCFRHWDEFETIEEAIESVNRHYYIQSMERYDEEWVYVDTCLFLNRE